HLSKCDIDVPSSMSHLPNEAGERRPTHPVSSHLAANNATLQRFGWIGPPPAWSMPLGDASDLEVPGKFWGGFGGLNGSDSMRDLNGPRRMGSSQEMPRPGQTILSPSPHGHKGS